MEAAGKERRRFDSATGIPRPVSVRPSYPRLETRDRESVPDERQHTHLPIMLIQSRDDDLRLIRQHDHGLVAGEMAAAWKGPLGSGAWDRVVVLATALHDLGWRELDEPPRWNPVTGRPHDFLDFPSEDKYEGAAGGIDRLEELHPYAAVLVSLHYTSFGGSGKPSEFDEEEEDRRIELLDSLGDDAPGPRQIQADLQALRLLDNLSLFLCLTPPAADPDERLSWLTADLLRLPAGSEVGRVGEPGQGGRADRGGRAGRERGTRPDAPAGDAEGERRTERVISLEWRGEDVAALDPYPFEEEELELEIPFRDLPRRSYPDAPSLERAWQEADEKVWRLRLVGQIADPKEIEERGE